ncbi:unnamed protein product [Mytilus coruscus]|uniref:Uncharacterized protein n=1 Tax=Mytilus coruscus TaxID=42192 RepID=A0A6J8A5W0_MYTCO|nr:unnamed protein product [Mytilus coruscus]
MQHHKDQTDQLKETNRNKCKGGIKNKDTDIQKIYDKNIVEAVAKNTYILNEYIWKRLKHSNERFKIEVKRHEKIEIENLKKYEQHIGKIEQKVHIDNQEAVNKVTEEANKHHKEKVQELQIKHDVIVRKLQSENKALKKELEYRPFLELQTYISKAKKLKDENQILKGKIKTLEEKQFELEKETIRLQQMEEEIKNLHKTVDKLEKESCMLNATVDEKVAENLTLEKANADLKSRMKKKEK